PLPLSPRGKGRNSAKRHARQQGFWFAGIMGRKARREGAAVRRDIDEALRDWGYKPGGGQARLGRARDGREVRHRRVALGLPQRETPGRPDGPRRHGPATYSDPLRREARRRPDLVLSEEQCQEADREFVQFYHRRLGWLALRDYARAVADADH